MRPTYEELAEQNAILIEQNAKLEARCRMLENLLEKALHRIAELEERLNKDSNNSSKPPSSDQKPNTPDRKKKPRKSRPGAARSLIPLEEVDRHEICELAECPHCKSKDLASRNDSLVIQQVELPETRGVVTQFDCQKYHCKQCNLNVTAPLPEGIPNSAFGPRLMAFIANLTGVFHLSKDDAKQLIRDLFSVEISDGSIINIEERVTEALSPVFDRIHQFVMESSFCKHFDETSWRDRGKTHYTWVASTKKAVVYQIDRRRSREAFEKVADKLNRFAPVVTDRYSAYNSLENPHQYCIPHLIRNFRKFSQREGPDGRIGSAIVDEFKYLSRSHRLYKREEISYRCYKQRVRRNKSRVENLLLDAMIYASQDLGDLCQRLLDEFENLFVFSQYEDAEPSNNLAERDLRRIVLWRKKSYGTRSERGQRYVETITTVSETVRRTKENILSFLQEAVLRFYRGMDAPFIQPEFNF